jgi:cyanophycinase
MPGLRTFLLLGSGEFEEWSHDVEVQALRRATGDGTVLVLPTASSREGDAVFDRWGRMGLDHYAEAGVPAELVPIKTRDDALKPEHAERIARASMVYFSGGKPDHLASVMGDTPSWSAVLAALDRGAVYAGCSAGAMVASQSRGRGRERGGLASFVFGMGLVPNVSFGVHWDRTKWIPGFRPLVKSRLPHGTWFAGIDERTAVLGDGVWWEVFGLRTVDVRGPEVARRAHAAGERFSTPDGRVNHPGDDGPDQASR